MRDIQAGRALRALRQRRAWRQVDLAVAAKVSQSTVSLTERGHFDRLSLAAARRIFGAVDASADLDIRWRGGLFDSLLDQSHARLVASAARLLSRRAWVIRLEASYSIYGERGSIDILAFHPASRTLVVVEVKSELTAVEATLRKLDEKVRLAPHIAAERFGWRAIPVASLLVVGATSTQRRRVARHAVVLDVAFPLRTDAARAWLRRPAGSVAALLFVSASDGGGGSQRAGPRLRIRLPLPRTNRPPGIVRDHPRRG